MASQGKYALRNGATKQRFHESILPVVSSRYFWKEVLLRRRRRRNDVNYSWIAFHIALRAYRISRKIAFFCAGMRKSAGFTRSR